MGKQLSDDYKRTSALSKASRRRYTDALVEAGVDGPGIGQCTNKLHLGLFGITIGAHKRLKGNPKGALRGHMTKHELRFTAAAETVAATRIRAKGAKGTAECADVSYEAGRAIAGQVATHNQRSRWRVPSWLTPAQWLK